MMRDRWWDEPLPSVYLRLLWILLRAWRLGPLFVAYRVGQWWKARCLARA